MAIQLKADLDVGALLDAKVDALLKALDLKKEEVQKKYEEDVKKAVEAVEKAKKEEMLKKAQEKNKEAKLDEMDLADLEGDELKAHKEAVEAAELNAVHPVFAYATRLQQAIKAFPKQDAKKEDVEALQKAFADAEAKLIAHYRNEGKVAVVDRIKQILLGLAGVVLGLIASPVLVASYFGKQEYLTSFKNTFFAQPETDMSKQAASAAHFDVTLEKDKDEKDLEVVSIAAPSAK